MTTFTVDEKLNFSKNHFSNLKELYEFLLYQNYISELQELLEDEYSQDLIEGANECLSIKEEDFVNI